jgi:hypothetical protein
MLTMARVGNHFLKVTPAVPWLPLAM